MQRQILVNIFVVYMLNFQLNMQTPIIAHNVLKCGTWFQLMTVSWYSALPLVSRYHFLDPYNCDISRVHCIILTLIGKDSYNHGMMMSQAWNSDYVFK